MPVLHKSDYKSPLFLSNGHLQTIYPSLFRKLIPPDYRRGRIATTDDDFIDLDWSVTGSKNLAIISHGLEGSTGRAYVVGMVNALNKAGVDALAWNFRSCSGEPNLKFKIYHNGDTEDLHTVIKYALKERNYENVALIGFSMGGNITLSYLGTNSAGVDSNISCAVVFSVPCDLKGSSAKLASPQNKIYMKRFLRMLYKKVKQKEAQYPGLISSANYNEIRNFYDFDNRYTAPIHGFRDADDYWLQCSSARHLENIRIPVLIVNAANDPFLSESCYPVAIAEKSKEIYLEIPASGGHVGFIQFNKQKIYWSEKRALEFIGDRFAAK